ncbi:hypothetical protein KP803_03980 [Vibrio sp. ZSDE26]|uniref:Uncharacterized protein n=1 Tax=Vibrio amylolyticus TaxID=2847292 RepID=A0A9X1XHZ0_9VIBR|nr:hypothetical protein [Vibrio amylolyticus]MCK6262425.1 hypothetical protein [Vibrio amylolyticus]
MKILFSFIVLIMCSYVHASPLPPLSASGNNSPHSLFVSSEQGASQFDSWKVDSGYSYNLFDKIDLYVGTRLDNSDNGENGFLSGVSYQLTNRVSLKSTLHTYSEVVDDTKSDTISAEVSSRMKLTDNIDLHATLDYQEWQQGIELGLGFRF